jgi:hypothetical protein
VVRNTSIVVVLVFASVTILVGTGAFQSVTADRSANVEVAGDSNALLRLTSYSGPNGNGQYADITGGTLEITDLNIDASTDIARVFNITNQGTQSVAVWITDRDTEDADIVSGVDENNTASITFYNPSYGGTGATENGVNSVESQENAVVLDTGDTLVVSIMVSTEDVASEEIDLLDSIVINADTDVDGAPGPDTGADNQ